MCFQRQIPYLMMIFISSIISCVVLLPICVSSTTTTTEPVVTEVGSTVMNSADDVLLTKSTPAAEEELSSSEEPVHQHIFEIAHFDLQHVLTPLAISGWILIASIAKTAFHRNKKLSLFFPESCLLVVLGILLGLVLFFFTKIYNEYRLSSDTFFLFLLPPIVFEAGYFMPNRAFFDNIGTILLYAVVGTLFNASLIGFTFYGFSRLGLFTMEIPLLHCLLFGSLISAVDPVAVLAIFEEIHVNEVLYILVFGESLLNDAVTVVLYNTLEQFTMIGENSQITTTDFISGICSFIIVAVCGTLIGLMWGFLTAFVSKFTDHVRVIEPLFVFVLSYISYLNAELFHLSGIMAIAFAGIFMSQYVEANISHKSHTTIKYFLKMLSSVCETVIFMFLGLSAVHGKSHTWDTAFIFMSLLLCLIYRSLGVIILTWFANKMRLVKLDKESQFVLAYGGLRGAVCFSLVELLDEKLIPAKPIFFSAAISVILFTVFVQGISIKPLVKKLRVKTDDKHKKSMNEQINERLIDHVMAGVEDITGFHGHHHWRDRFEHINAKYLQPMLLRDPPQSMEPSIIRVFTKLNIRDAMDYVRRNQSSLNLTSLKSVGSENSLSRLLRSASFNAQGGVPNQLDTNVCLDMNGIHSTMSVKDMKDTFLHHRLLENMPKARFRDSNQHHTKRHIIPDSKDDMIHRSMQLHLRRCIHEKKHHHGKHGRHHKSSHHSNHSHTHLNIHNQHNVPKKNVSFQMIDIVDKHEHIPDIKVTGSSDESDDDDKGITFTVNREKQEFEECDARAVPSHDLTAAEKMLPWKRTTGSEGEPSISVQSVPARMCLMDLDNDNDNDSPFEHPPNEHPSEWCEMFRPHTYSDDEDHMTSPLLNNHPLASPADLSEIESPCSTQTHNVPSPGELPDIVILTPDGDKIITDNSTRSSSVSSLGNDPSPRTSTSRRTSDCSSTQTQDCTSGNTERTQDHSNDRPPVKLWIGSSDEEDDMETAV